MKYAGVAALIGLDLATGLIQAVKNKNFKSSCMREGIFHKLGEVLEIALCFTVDYYAAYLGMNIPFSLETCSIAYLSVMECGSIIENLSLIDKRMIPEKLRNLFEIHK